MEKTVKHIKAAVAGALSIDICPVFDSTNAKSFGDIIKPSMVTHISGNEIHPGGPVANTGIAMNIFGVEPVLCAKIGNDDFGSMLINMLQRSAGSDSCAGIVTDDHANTAYSVILAPPGLDRAILQDPGANDAFTAGDIDFDALEGCSLLHFGHPSTMKSIYDNDGEDLEYILRTARDRGMATSLDLCAIDPASDAGSRDWASILKRVLPYVDFFVPSYEELRCILIPERQAEEAELAAVSSMFGASNILIKHGQSGMYYMNAGRETQKGLADRAGLGSSFADSWADRKGRIGAVEIEKEVSGLGAGDTSVAAYLCAMLRGYSFDECIRLAAAEGALCVTRVSATGGLEPFEAL